MKDNAMKTKLAAGEPTFGLSVMIPSPQIVESAAGMGFDWVLIDCEHGTVGLESMELMVMAADGRWSTTRSSSEIRMVHSGASASARSRPWGRLRQ